MIVKTEIEDFQSLVRARGGDPDDFELIVEQAPLPAGAIAPVTGKISVASKKSGAKRTYRSGHGTAWVHDFYQDLAEGKFLLKIVLDATIEPAV
jgi:hypothetical protein